MQDVDSARVAARVAQLVDAYARRIYPAVLAQHAGAAVCSPLGIWLLLAACVTGAEGEDVRALERVLGCPAGEAAQLLAALIAEPPPALRAAIAVWVRAIDATEVLAGWIRTLPAAVESGLMPTQADADAWTDRKTMGLIKRLPITIDALTRIVLVSALATKVSWERPFGIVPAADELGESSPWRGRVQRLLSDSRPAGRAMLAHTRAAGLVAVQLAVAKEDLTVISVSADPGVPREAVLDGAHELASGSLGTPESIACSLFELQLGVGHSWQISERQTATRVAGERLERIAAVSLPAWRVDSVHNLKASDLFGSGPALETLRALIGPNPDDKTEAVQAAVASFTRYGFEAAAVTGFAAIAMARMRPPQTGIERIAKLRFDHPFAAVAVAGRPALPGSGQRSAFTGLPLFSAWVAEPVEADDDLPVT
jgi:hypothetical protein